MRFQCTSQCSNKLRLKYLVPRAIFKYVSLNTPQTELSAPWAMAALNISTALLLTLKFSSPSARPSAVTISVSNIVSRTLSANSSVGAPWKLKCAYLELTQLWRFESSSIWRASRYHQVRVQLQKQTPCQRSFPASRLQMFQYGHSSNWTEWTFSYRHSEHFYCTPSDIGIVRSQCASKCSNKLRHKYLVPKANCKYFSMNTPQTELSEPWAIAAVKMSTALLLMSESLSPSAPPSAVTILASNILSRKPSANISVWESCKLNSAHLELLPLWIISLHSTWRQDIHHAVYVQVRWQSQYRISCPESHLQIFEYEHPAKLKWSHFELLQPWRLRSRCFWRRLLYHPMHV